MSKTRMGVECHTRKKDDLERENKGFGKNLRKKSGFSKGVSACDKTKKVRKHRGFFGGGEEEFGGECHIFALM